MSILAIETSSDACSCAAVLADGSLVERHEVVPRRHTAMLLPMVRSLLAEAGLGLSAVDAVAYGAGPGSFTGVRIAASTAQGLALGLDRPLLPVSSLAALALGAADESARVLAVLDARMGEVYLGAYEVSAEGDVTPAGREHLAAPEQVELPPEGKWFGVGPGWASHGHPLAVRLGERLGGFAPNRLPAAREVARLAALRLARGEGRPAATAVPDYLRREVATPRAGS